MENDTSHLTTYRCIRLCCRLTVRRIDPIDRCPRCRAMLQTIERSALQGFDRLRASST